MIHAKACQRCGQPIYGDEGHTATVGGNTWDFCARCCPEPECRLGYRMGLIRAAERRVDELRDVVIR